MAEAIPQSIQQDEVSLTQEQIKRAELLAEYEKEVEGPHAERNAGIEAHDQEWSEKWAKLQGEIDQARANKATELEKSGVPANQHKSILDMEAAKVLEAHEIGRAKAAADLDAKLPQPRKWLDFLQEKSLKDGDPTIAALIEEAKQSPEPSFEGASGGLARPVLSDLTYKIDRDGVHYQRAGKEVLCDTGPRLDVKKLDDRDIEAALRIAGQKFDVSQGLVLTGDAVFKMRSAEIAGRLGMPVQGHDPVIQSAWAKGRDSVNPLRQVQSPSIDRSISGVVREIDLKPVRFPLDPRLADHAEKLGVGLVERSDKGVTAEMPAERYLAAMAAWRDTGREVLDKLAGADLTKPESLELAELGQNQDILPLIETDRNELSQLGRDLVLVRDAHAIEAQERTGSIGLYVTSQDRVAREAVRFQNEKALISRNVDEQAVEKKEQKPKREVGDEAKRIAALKQEERAVWAAGKVNRLPEAEREAAADKFKEANRGGNADEIAEQSQALIDRVQQSHEKVQEHEVKHLPEHDLSGFDGLDMGR